RLSACFSLVPRSPAHSRHEHLIFRNGRRQMKRLVLHFVLAVALTLPVFFLVTSFDALVAWMYGETGWELLIPLFRLYGAVGVEGEDEVVAGVLLIASFALAL